MPGVAGILPLNYARQRLNRLYHAIIEGYASRSRVFGGHFQAVGYGFRRLATPQPPDYRQISAFLIWSRISARLPEPNHTPGNHSTPSAAAAATTSPATRRAFARNAEPRLTWIVQVVNLVTIERTRPRRQPCDR